MWALLIICFDHTLPELLPSVTQSEPESKGTLWFDLLFFFWRGGTGLGGVSYEINVCTDFR